MGSISPLVVTYNCGRELIRPEVFARHLSSAYRELPAPELIFISLQEISPISYAFLGGSYLRAYFDRVYDTIDLITKSWGIQYTHLLTQNVGMTAFILLARYDVSEQVRWLESGGTGVGFREMGNKGAVAARLGYATPNDVIELTFIAAHLAPKEHAVQRRNEDWKDIVRKLVFMPIGSRRKNVEATSDDSPENEPLIAAQGVPHATSGIYNSSSYVFLAGDLNYRTSKTKPDPGIYDSFPQPSENGDRKHFANLLKNDQLKQEMQANRTLHGFTESEIDFPPTYKYSNKRRMLVEEKENQGEDFDADLTSDWGWAMHRWPSWCDRILFLEVPHKIKVQKYTALPLMSTSDHRPVILSISVSLLPIPPSSTEGLNPFAIDPSWYESRTAARRREVAFGLLSYIGVSS